jgi:hypothetical protein
MASICGTFGKHVEERTWYRDAAAEWEKILLKGLIFPDSEQEIEDAKRGASANH